MGAGSGARPIAAAGGCLRLHAATVLDVAPLLDRLVVFHSADLRHEVLPTAARRLSLTGWMSRAPLLPR
mgnify:CR=1 FL=1